MLDEGVDLVDQFLDASKRASADGPLGDQGKPAFDLIQPGRVGRGVMNLVARPLGQPGTHFGMFVRRVIVDDQVDVQLRRDAIVEVAQKGKKFLVSMSWFAFGEDGAGGDIQCGKQSSGAVADVIVSDALDVAEPHGQNRLGSVERLNLAFLVHTQHQSVIGRVQIQAHNIAYLLDEERIGGEFGIGGKMSLRVDALQLADGDQIELRGSKDVKGGSRTKLMVGAMIITSLIFLPAAPVFLLTPGHQSTVVKSTEITAQVDGATPVLAAGLQRSEETASEVAEMMRFLPPRVFDAEGREGDMLNLVFVAQPADLQRAFTRAGWVKTDRWRPVFVWHLLQRGTNDAKLPMARFNLFGRVQDYSYALPDPDSVVSRRHHVRIWKTDYTMDGTPIWVGAATHDLAIEIAKRGHLINHRIDPDVDAERNFIGAELAGVSSVSREKYVLREDPVFRAQTVSGETYYSDSRILFLDLEQTSLSNADVLKQSSIIVRASTGPIAVPAASLQSHLASAH